MFASSSSMLFPIFNSEQAALLYEINQKVQEQPVDEKIFQENVIYDIMCGHYINILL